MAINLSAFWYSRLISNYPKYNTKLPTNSKELIKLDHN